MIIFPNSLLSQHHLRQFCISSNVWTLNDLSPVEKGGNSIFIPSKLKSWTIHIVKFCNEHEIPACHYIWNFGSWETVRYLFVLYFYANLKFPWISFNLILSSCGLLQGKLASSFDMDTSCFSCDKSDYWPYVFHTEKTTRQW